MEDHVYILYDEDGFTRHRIREPKANELDKGERLFELRFEVPDHVFEDPDPPVAHIQVPEDATHNPAPEVDIVPPNELPNPADEDDDEDGGGGA